MKKVEDVPDVVGVAPFVINPMMVTHGDHTATGVLLKGVDPELMPQVLDLPKHIVDGQRSTGCVARARSRPSAPFDPLRDELDDLARSTPAHADGGHATRCSTLMQQRGRRGDAPRRRAAPRPTRRPPPTARRRPTPAAPAAPPQRASPTATVTPARRLQEPAPRTTTSSPTSVDPDPCKSPEQVATHAGHRRRPHARQAARRRPRRLRAGHLAADRPLVRRRRALAHRQAVPRHRRLRGGLRPVRLEARLHRPLRGAGLLRVRRQRHRHRDEGRRHRPGRTRSPRRSTQLPQQRHLPHDGLAASSTTASSRRCSSSRSG